MAIRITSIAFEEGEMIPQKYTCDGKEVSPPLAWSGVPSGTKSFALICDDPDAPAGTWVHWVLFDLPAGTKELSENIPPKKTLESGAKHGINDFREFGYGGPCPLVERTDTSLGSMPWIRRPAWTLGRQRRS
jgi:Raf kinase inhibitor-like YbhB/YbcL family protein